MSLHLRPTEAIDWRMCPNCDEELEVASSEMVEARYSILIYADPDTGEAINVDWREGEADWSSSETDHYFCTACAEQLPDAHQDALDRILNNRRATR